MNIFARTLVSVWGWSVEDAKRLSKAKARVTVKRLQANAVQNADYIDYSPEKMNPEIKEIYEECLREIRQRRRK